MSKCRATLLVFLSLALWAPVCGQSREAALEGVLAQLEKAGSDFSNFSADFSQRKYTAVLEEFDQPESGNFLYARDKNGSAMLRQEVTRPASRILTIKSGRVTMFQPALKYAQIINLGQNKDKAEYLALGIGQSPRKLQETFDLSYRGVEKVNGASCSMLELRPKGAAAAAYFSSITLWIKESNGVPVRQKLLEPSGDYLIVNFSNEKLNGKVPASKFEQKLPKGVELVSIG